MDKKMIIIIAVNSVILLLLMVGGFFFMLNRMTSYKVEDQKHKHRDKPAEEKAAKASTGPVFPLDTFIVNLAEESGRRYLRVTIELELGDEKLKKEVQERSPMIRDTILMILPAQKAESVLSLEGKNELRNAILGKLNGLLKTGKITNLYFTEFVIQ